jgi:hypothetical protein
MRLVFKTPHHSPRFRRAYVVCQAFRTAIDAGERVVLTRLRRLALVGRLIYGHFHATQRDWGSTIYFPFYATTSFAAVKSAKATTPTTVSVEKDGVKLYPTV